MAAKPAKKSSALPKLIVGAVAVVLCLLLCLFLITSVKGIFSRIGSGSAQKGAAASDPAPVYDPPVAEGPAVPEVPAETVKPDELAGDWTDDLTGMSFDEIGSDASAYEEGVSVDE